MESGSDIRPLTRWQMWKASLVGWLGTFAIASICSTLRWQSTGDQYLQAIDNSGHRAIFTFWHGRIFTAIYYWRHRGIMPLISMNADGEAAARCVERFGYLVARGSSSQGGRRALVQMIRAIHDGHDPAFTVDGPRGPRYVAKEGPILLAFKTGAAILCFHI